MTKNGIKTGFLDFEENHVISFVWNLCKMKFLSFINILRKLHA